MDKTILEEKIRSLQQEIQDFATNAQIEVNNQQQLLQTKIRDSQQRVDQLQGKLSAYLEVLNEISAPASIEPLKPEGT